MAYRDKADQRAYAKAHYEAHKAIYKDRAVAYSRGQRRRLRELIDEAKDVPCADCGQRYPAWVMDFDHIADDKTGDIASMIGRALSIKRVRREIAKCEVVCANCHRQRTHDRGYDYGDRGAAEIEGPPTLF